MTCSSTNDCISSLLDFCVSEIRDSREPRAFLIGKKVPQWHLSRFRHNTNIPVAVLSPLILLSRLLASPKKIPSQSGKHLFGQAWVAGVLEGAIKKLLTVIQNHQKVSNTVAVKWDFLRDFQTLGKKVQLFKVELQVNFQMSLRRGEAKEAQSGCNFRLFFYAFWSCVLESSSTSWEDAKTTWLRNSIFWALLCSALFVFFSSFLKGKESCNSTLNAKKGVKIWVPKLILCFASLVFNFLQWRFCQMIKY